MTVVRDSLIPGLGGKVDIHMCAFARRCVNVCFREGKDSVMGCLHKTEGPRVSVLARRATSSHTVSGREPSAGSPRAPDPGSQSTAGPQYSPGGGVGLWESVDSEIHRIGIQSLSPSRGADCP